MLPIIDLKIPIAKCSAQVLTSEQIDAQSLSLYKTIAQFYEQYYFPYPILLEQEFDNATITLSSIK